MSPCKQYEMERGPSSHNRVEACRVLGRTRRRNKARDWEERDVGSWNNPTFGIPTGRAHAPGYGRLTNDLAKVHFLAQSCSTKISAADTDSAPQPAVLAHTYLTCAEPMTVVEPNAPNVTAPTIRNPDKVFAQWRARVESNARSQKARDVGIDAAYVTIDGTRYRHMRLSRHFRGLVVLSVMQCGAVMALTRASVCVFDSITSVPRDGTSWLRWWLEEPPRGLGSSYISRGTFAHYGNDMRKAVMLLTALRGSAVGGLCVRLVCPGATRGWMSCADIINSGIDIPAGGVYVSRLPGFVHLSKTGTGTCYTTATSLRIELSRTPDDIVGEGHTSVFDAFCARTALGSNFKRAQRYSGPLGLRELPKFVYRLDKQDVIDAPPPSGKFAGQVKMFSGAGGSGKTSAVAAHLDGEPVIVIVPRTRLVSSNKDIKDIVMQRVHQCSGALISLVGKGFNVVDVVPYDEVPGRQFRYPVLIDDVQRCRDVSVISDLVTRSHAGLFVTFGVGQQSGWCNVVELCYALPTYTELVAYDPLGEDYFRSTAATVIPTMQSALLDVFANSLLMRMLFGVCGDFVTGVEIASHAGCVPTTSSTTTSDRNDVMHGGIVEDVVPWICKVAERLGVDMPFFEAVVSGENCISKRICSLSPSPHYC